MSTGNLPDPLVPADVDLLARIERVLMQGPMDLLQIDANINLPGKRPGTRMRNALRAGVCAKRLTVQIDHRGDIFALTVATRERLRALDREAA